MSTNGFAAAVTWLGGAEWSELDERHHRSTGMVAGVVVLVTATLTALVTTAVLEEAARWPTLAALAVAVVFGVFVAAVSRGIASGPKRGWSGVLARVVVAMICGAVVGEIAAMAIFAGSISTRLDEHAARDADSTPVVVAASEDLNRIRAARTALDDAVTDASRRRDDALVVARCEFNPSPACPQTHITGLPGAGPENRTANSFLMDTQRQLDTAVAERDGRAPELDGQIAMQEQVLAHARDAAIAQSDRGLGARWSAMNAHSVASPGALVLRVLTGCFFALLILLPLILKLWRGQTTQDRGITAREERERAEIDAETTIAVKRAEVRAEIETMWAEQQLASARMAIEAQNEIDRETQRRRVAEALEPAEAPMQMAVESARVVEPLAELPSKDAPDNLPALVESAELAPRERGLIPVAPAVTKTATRWIRPFVPPIVASAIETTTRPLRSALGVFEETEEIHFSLRRSHRISMVAEETVDPPAEEAMIEDASTELTPIEPTPVKAARVQRPKGQPPAQVRKPAERRQLSSGDS